MNSFNIMEPIKVLQIIPSLSRVSGVTNFVLNLYRNIDRERFQFDIMYFSNDANAYDNEFRELGANLIYIPKLRLGRVYSFTKQIAHFFSENRSVYSAIHLHEVLVGVIVLPIAAKYGVDIRIVHSHNSLPSEKFIRALRNNLLCLPLKRLSTHWIACSIKAGEFLYGRKAMNRVMIANNGLKLDDYKFDPTIRTKMRSEIGIKDQLVIGHIGRFCIQKNQGFLIEILKHLEKKIKNYYLVIVGTGSLEGDFKDKLKLSGLEKRVIFLGVRADIPKILQGFDIFVLPSLFEGLPIVGVEAQAAGLPCVFSDTITNEAKIIDNVSFLSLKVSPEVWADEIIRISHSFKREDTSRKLSDKGFDINDTVFKLQLLYGDVKDKHKL